MFFWLPSPISHLTKATTTQWDNFPQEKQIKRRKRNSELNANKTKMPALVLSIRPAVCQTEECLARPLVIPGYDTWTSSVGVNMCLCAKTHTLSGVGIQWRRRFVEGVCILLGIGWHLGSTYHSTWFLLGGWHGGRCSVSGGKRSPFPGARKGQGRTGQDMTGQDRERKHKFVQAK